MSINRINNHPEMVEESRGELIDRLALDTTEWDKPLTVKSCAFWDEPIEVMIGDIAYEATRLPVEHDDPDIETVRMVVMKTEAMKLAEMRERIEFQKGAHGLNAIESIWRLGQWGLNLCSRLIIKLRFVDKGRTRQDKSKQTSID